MLCVIVAAALYVTTASGQTPVLPVLDHIHLLVPDQAKGVEWYRKYFGGQPMTEAPDRLMLGETRLIFLHNDKGQPSTGSALDHIGFSVPDIDATMKELEAGGVKVSSPVREVQGLFKLAFMYSGVWLLVQRGEATPSEGHAIDHIGWRTPNLEAKTRELKAQSVKFTTEPRPLRLASGDK